MTFKQIQADLGAALAANTPGSGQPHVLVVLPSFSVSETLLAHYGERITALEHRYLLSALMTHRLDDVDYVYLSSRAPDPEVIDYYRSLGPREAAFQARTWFVSVDDLTPRCMADKLLDRPDLVEWLREFIAGRPAFMEPWNVTEHEVAVAERLQLPLNGMDPSLRHLGYKSAGRRLFRRAGVRVPYGWEDVHSIDDLRAAITDVQLACPDAAGVVIKHDDSGAGDGNVVIDLRDSAGARADARLIHEQLLALPDWYLGDLRRGGIVEELIAGSEFRSPSAQIDLLPDGSVVVLATHEQLLGGENGQVFLGCRFPADAAYAGELAGQARAVGERLAAAGVTGRASIDFAAARNGSGHWDVYALEVNLRKGGTTHPYAALRNLVPGRYDPNGGRWVAPDGSPRAYVCTDNLLDETWIGLEPSTVIDAVTAGGCRFDHRSGTGVILHMLSGLGIDGRIGLTAIGTTPDLAQALFDRACDLVAAAAASRS